MVLLSYSLLCQLEIFSFLIKACKLNLYLNLHLDAQSSASSFSYIPIA